MICVYAMAGLPSKWSTILLKVHDGQPIRKPCCTNYDKYKHHHASKTYYEPVNF